MFGTRGRAVVLVAAAVAGYAGAAAFSALALPSVEIASDYGPGDGLTRYVVTASTDAVTGGSGSDGSGAAGGAGGSGGSGSAGAGGSDGSSGTAELVVRRGPHGERLVRSAHFAGLSSIWSLDCSAACTGVAI